LRRDVAVLTDLRYSVRSLTRTPGVALALVLTIALGIGSNASVFGFIRGSITLNLPLQGIESVVSLFERGAQDAFSPVSFERYLSLKTKTGVFESVGAARESRGSVAIGDRTSVMSIAAVTPELTDLLHLSLGDGVVISDRVWQNDFGARVEVRGERIRVDGADIRVADVAPAWLSGLYNGRAVDIWIPLKEASLQGFDRSSRTFWTLGRLRSGVSIDQARAAVNSTRSAADATAVLRYTGIPPEVAGGISRVGALLPAAAWAVFFMACANVATFLLSRASTRSHETSVRVALGAGRSHLAKQLISDSVIISAAGGVFGILLAVWTADAVPALFFQQDAEQLRFTPDLPGILAASVACAGITILCGLLPLFEIRHDDPAVVLRRESAGPSNAMRRLRGGLVVMQMTLCCLLVISTGLLLRGFRTALQTSAGHRLGPAILATVQARIDSSSRQEISDHGLKYFHDAESAAGSVAGVSAVAWVGTLPGSPPAWQSMRFEPPQLPLRDVAIDVAAFTSRTLAVVAVPPVAGRLFSGGDTAQACRVVIVNEEAAAALFNGDVVGRTIEDPAGQRVQVIGVVATRKTERAPPSNRPAIYYYADQAATPLNRIGPGLFRVPAWPKATSGVLDTHVVSPSYFEAMGMLPVAGRVFAEHSAPSGCRVGVINQEAAELYFGGNAVGGAVIDGAGQRTEIIGVVHSVVLRTSQRGAEPSIYLPMAQDVLPRMTMILGAREANRTVLASVRRQLDAVPGGAPGAVVTTLDAHLSRTALAPERIATALVGASTITALALGVLGLYGVMADAARQRRREIGVRIALGAPGWRVIHQLLAEGARLAGAGAIAGMLASFLTARWLARITLNVGSPTAWVWLAAPLVLVGAVAIASVLPARRALRVDPLEIMRDN
jgi:putative ABC transport system permease protein